MTRFADLAAVSSRVASTSARNEKAATLAAFLRGLEPAEIVPAVAHLSGELRQGRIGLGPAAIRAAAQGNPASEPSLGLLEVDAAFDRIAAARGSGSTGERVRLFANLLGRATPDEHRFLVRLSLGELRQGALQGVMEESIARAAGLPASQVRQAVMIAGDLGAVAHASLTQGAAGLAGFRIELFRPLQPMLAQAAEDIDDAIARLGEAALEYKLDGARVQVHRGGEQVRVYSRSLKDVTAAVPELVEVVRALPAGDLILDGEVIALRADGAPHPFSTTMRRFGRRLDVERLREAVPLTPFFFDVLRAGGEDLIGAPARERFAALKAVAPRWLVPRRVTADRGEAEAFLKEALARGHEGIMAKAPEALYEAGSRGAGWLKVKPAHTLDLVVLAVERGSGRRSGWLSNIHLGARDPAIGGFQMIGKTFKGMTDAMLEWQTGRFRELAVDDDGYVVRVRPEQVVEVAFNNVQRSPVYESGLALRFARVKRYREDKGALEADTIEMVHAILEAEERGGPRPDRG